MRLSLTNIIGVIFSVGILIFGITEITGATGYINSIPTLSDYQFLNIPSLFIVLGGVLNAAFITYQPKYVGQALGSVFYLFNQSRISHKKLSEDLKNILEWSDQVKANRIKAMSSLEKENGDEVTGYFFSLINTNYTNDEIKEFAGVSIEEHYFRKMVVVDVLRAMGGAAPSFGMFGTLFGLVVMLGQLENPSGMGPGLAAALITTLYGISLARFIFYPMSEKLKNIAQQNRYREYFMLEGVLLINSKKSSFYIQDKLKTYLRRDLKGQQKKEKG
ncbi:MAG: MotA/TolQ/ExbB proton channel family protein [Balneola sp.]|nr:MotA/TolQ/ExbB proton channel family protein [Balneola sp.]MBO6650478.1 MotA/TolQ/ExbB proton channel family protein [Balneola sp.]MBO6711475.1 MotA/TolQ/ExbB proton channel family protein [Balneola sp.]MBO6799671.1 MotA/TolQ/ExbB proton channel family protein [Balneola sp.]MBO6870888.1 MotA/TolQ/ExbB proton channel family protein [Balneola sp.]